MKSSYNIPSEHVDTLAKRIAALNKKAQKYGTPVISMFTDGELFFETWKDEDGHEFTVQLMTVVVEGESPTVRDPQTNEPLYQFVARIEHGTPANLVFTVPGLDVEIPAHYWQERANCDHCGVYRRRNNTYLVQELKTGDLKQVGSTCLKDFMGGIDPHRIASLMEGYWDIEEEVAHLRGFGSAKPFFRLDIFMACVVKSIQERGWVSSTAVREAQEQGLDYPCLSTWSDAATTMRNLRQDETDLSPFMDTAQSIIDWVRQRWGSQKMETLNAYHRNLVTAMAQDFIEYKSFGLCASAWAAHRRETEYQQRERTDRASSTYQGRVDGKLTVEIRVRRVIAIPGMYGMSELFIMEDTQGNIYTWKSTCYSGMVENGYYRLAGTVKEHSEYKGVQQTVLTRCKAVEIPAVQFKS